MAFWIERERCTFLRSPAVSPNSSKVSTSRFARVVENLRDVVGGKVQIQFNGVPVRRTNHAVFDLVAAFLIGVRNGLKVPPAEPVIMSSLVPDGFGKLLERSPIR